MKWIQEVDTRSGYRKWIQEVNETSRYRKWIQEVNVTSRKIQEVDTGSEYN